MRANVVILNYDSRSYLGFSYLIQDFWQTHSTTFLGFSYLIQDCWQTHSTIVYRHYTHMITATKKKRYSAATNSVGKYINSNPHGQRHQISTKKLFEQYPLLYSNSTNLQQSYFALGELIRYIFYTFILCHIIICFVRPLRLPKVLSRSLRTSKDLVILVYESCWQVS